MPQSPYKGISVESLAISVKSLPCVVSWNEKHQQCSIVGEVVRRVDEVLARLDRIDVWGATWGQGSGGKDAEEGRIWPVSFGFPFETVSLRYGIECDAEE